MNEKEFKQHQAEQMRRVAEKGRKAFRAKFKSNKELSDYMRKLAKKRHGKRN